MGEGTNCRATTGFPPTLTLSPLVPDGDYFVLKSPLQFSNRTTLVFYGDGTSQGQGARHVVRGAMHQPASGGSHPFEIGIQVVAAAHGQGDTFPAPGRTPWPGRCFRPLMPCLLEMGDLGDGALARLARRRA